MKGEMRAVVSIAALACAGVWPLASRADAQTSAGSAPTTESSPVAPNPPGSDTSPQATENDALETIVVTAERRVENLQKVPIAATAITGDQLAAKAVERVSDLQYAAPSLSITDAGLTQSVNIRGIGIASGSPAVANGVATYIDGMFQPPILTMSSFYDIASVEVLRGPQGTLVGSNSTGGAIFINTQSPTTDHVKGYAQASYGNYNDVTAQGAVNVPISSDLAVRAAGNFERRDSYFNDLGPLNNHPDRLNEKAGRVGLLWKPGSFRATLKAEWVDRSTGGYAYRPILGTAFDYDRQPNIRDLTYNSPTSNHERGFLTTAELRYELDSGIVLRSVSGYTNKRINNLYDSDAAMTQLLPTLDNPFPPSATQTEDQFVRERELTEEVNIISPTTGAFNWIVGGYYQRNKIDVVIQNRSSNPIVFNPADPTDVLISQDKLTLGAFAQAGYKITPDVEIQLGARYSHFKADSGGSVTIGSGSPFFPPGGIQVADLAGEHADGRLTGKAAINWSVDENNLIYAFAARGYKPGGANSATSEFGPETVWDYEIGWKSAFFDNHLRTQLGAFYMDYSDFQFDARDPTTGQAGVDNISSATIKGIELQAQAKFGGFGFDGGIAYVDSNLDEVLIVNTRALPPIGQFGPQCPPGVPSNPPACFDYGPFIAPAAGGPNLLSPKWSYNVGVQYEAVLSDNMTLTPRLNYAYVGPTWTNLFYVRQTDYLPSHALLSALLTLRRGNWTVEGYGRNLTNKKFVSGQFGNNEFYGAPREYGLRVAVRF